MGRERESRGRDEGRREEKSKEANESIRRQTEAIYEAPDFSYSSILDPDMEIKEYFCKSQDEAHELDIIPYTATKNHPQCSPNGVVRPGDRVFVAEYWVHKRIGASGAMVLCLARTFPNSNLGCPICEKRSELGEDYGWEDKEVKKLKPMHFGLYNVLVYDDEKERKKGVQTWLIQWAWFGKPLKMRSKNPRTGGLIYYADKDVGKSISFYKKGKDNITFEGHQFLDRDYIISDDILDQAYILEDLVPIPTYDDVAKLFLSGKGKERDRDEEDKEEGSKRKEKGDRGDREREKEMREGSRGRGRYESDDNKEDSDDKEDKRREGTRERGRGRVDRERKSDVMECEYGGVFGEDIDRYDECVTDCKIYDECAIEADRIAEEKKEKEKRGTRGEERSTRGRREEPVEEEKSSERSHRKLNRGGVSTDSRRRG